MLIKILLFLCIVLSALTLVVSELKLKEKISTITAETSKAKEDLDGMTKQKEKFAKDLGVRTDELDKANTDLKGAQDSAKTAMDAAAAEAAKTAAAQAEVQKAKAETVNVKKSAEEWLIYEAAGNKLADVKKREAELPLLRESRATATDEMKILAIQYQKVKGELDSVKYKDVKVVLPEGLQGKVVVVDPKWDFVVLNIGAAHGVKHNGELFIDRGGKLVGKVQVMNVEANHSIANIMQGWKKGDVMEGDTVKFSP